MIRKNTRSDARPTHRGERNVEGIGVNAMVLVRAEPDCGDVWRTLGSGARHVPNPNG